MSKRPLFKNKRSLGLFYAIFSAATFGLIPLFSLPVIHSGISTETTLVYRFGVATLILLPIIYFSGHSLYVKLADLLKLAGVSTLYMLAVLLFFNAFTHLPSSIVATLQYLYPVMVMLIMIGFFGEKFNWRIVLAVGLSVTGVAFLSQSPGSEESIEPGAAADAGNYFFGIILALVSGLCNALYIVSLKVARLSHINSLVMTFYVMGFGGLYSFINALFNGTLQWITTPAELGLAFMLALVTAVLSNLTLILAVQYVGPTMVSILGVMEPLTAVTCGILVFGEPLSIQLVLGIIIISLAVFMVLFKPAA